MTNGLTTAADFAPKTNLVPVWAALVTVVGGLAVAYVAHKLRVRSDKKTQREQKFNELKAWFSEIGHYAERSETVATFIKEFKEKLAEAPKMTTIAKQDFQSLENLIAQLTDRLSGYLRFSEASCEVGDPHGLHEIGENRRLLAEIVELVKQFEREAENVS